MKVIFISNYFNHHQKPLSDALDRLTGGDYRFIATSRMREERRKLGYGGGTIPGYVIDMNDQSQYDRGIEAINAADAIIVGSCPRELFRMCVSSGKPVFCYSERFMRYSGALKNIRACAGLLRRFPKKRGLYLLAAGAYAYGDFARLGLFRDSAYKWGYFPQTERYGDVDALLSQKKPASIVWVGRFIECKHFEHMLDAAERLMRSGYKFTLDVIGSGELEDKMKEKTAALGLADRVSFLGPMPPEQVRGYMEKSRIAVVNSDRYEGWCAVVNEFMNSACALIASAAPGSVSFLINDGVNGMIYRYGDVGALTEKLAYLLDNDGKRASIGKAAYDTVADLWNADTAAERFIALAERVLSGLNSPDIFADGPCSRAEKIYY